MRALALVLLLCSTALAETSTVTLTKTSNGTTLPFQRHIVRVGPPQAGAGTLVFAVQKQGTDRDGLVLYTSDDEGRTWSRGPVVQGDSAVRDTADMVADPDGTGFSLVYGVEPRSSTWSTDARFDVVYLHYTLGPGGVLERDVGPVVVFAPKSTQGYFRPALARDATGTLHVTATLFDGSTYRWLHRLSVDAGREWTEPEELARFLTGFGGGRIVAAGSQLVALFDGYRSAEPGGRYRTRPAGPCGDWDDAVVFASDGLYHAGAFSAVATPDGHVHLGYSDKRNQRLWYREFDGLSWSAATQMESTGVWSNQPAVAFRGDELLYGWNKDVDGTGARMKMVVRRRVNGSWGAVQEVDVERVFKGYTAAIASVPAGEAWPLAWSQDPASGTGPALVRCAPVPP